MKQPVRIWTYPRVVYDQVRVYVAVDGRSYGIGAAILVDLGIARLRPIITNPAKYGGIDGYGLEISGRVGFSCPTG